MFLILQRAQTAALVVLACFCGYLLYTRPNVHKSSETVATTTTDTSTEVTKIDTVTDIKPSGEKIIKTTKVILKKADKSIVASETKIAVDTHVAPDSPYSKPGLAALPRYSLGFNFSPASAQPEKIASVELGIRAIGPLWLTASARVKGQQEILMGVKMEW
jgi:hypothetical protein